MNTPNKCLKIGASFPGFCLLQIPRLARLSLLTPCLTLARTSQPKTCLFHPAAGESHPSRLRVSISSQVTEPTQKAYPTTLPVDCEAFRPLNFTLPSKPVQLGEPRSPDGRRREHSQPDNLLFSSPRSSRLTVRHGDPETTVGREPPS